MMLEAKRVVRLVSPGFTPRPSLSVDIRPVHRVAEADRCRRGSRPGLR